jgi:peptidoglycan/LPS O-acetylase OafA/YrhL
MGGVASRGLAARSKESLWSPNKTDNAALTGLRAVAALLVYFAHAAGNGLLPGFLATAPFGDCGVMLFFALSGFLMAALYLRQEFTFLTVRNFILARIARIYPLFAVTVLASAFVFRADSDDFPFWLNGRKALEHLLLWGDGLTLWTISVEFQFYTAFIGLWAAYAFLPRSICDLAFGAISVGLIVLLATLGFPGDRIAITHYAHFFLIGCVAALVVWNVAPVKRKADCALAILFGLLLFLTAILPPPTVEANSYRFLPLLIIAGAIVLFTAHGTGIIANRLLASRILVYFGEISFGLYLLHRPAMYLWQEALGLTLHWALMFLLITLTLVCVAHIAHVGIERPARAFLRGFVAAEREEPVNVRSGSLGRVRS